MLFDIRCRNEMSLDQGSHLSDSCCATGLCVRRKVTMMSLRWFFYVLLMSATTHVFAEDFSGSARFGFNEHGFYVHMNIKGHSWPYMFDRYYPLTYPERYAGRSYGQLHPIYTRNQGDRRIGYNYQPVNGHYVHFIEAPQYQGHYIPHAPVLYPLYVNPYLFDFVGSGK